MEDLIFLILCILTFININIKGINNFFYDYMEIKNTNSVKGIFVWMILLSHYKGYYKEIKYYIYRKILDCFGQKMVSLFLFYSGYGVYESIKIKGITYVRSLPKKATILFFKAQIVLLLFLFNNLFLGIKVKLKNYFLSIIFKSSIGNSNWFAFTIINFYFYSYISFILFNNKKSMKFLGLIIITIICLLHIYFVYNYFYPKKMYTVDNTLCFIFGYYYSFIKKYFDKIIMKDDIQYLTILSIFIALYYYFYSYKNKDLFINLITNSIFSLNIVFISMKIRFNNEFLNLLNSHSYSIYLLQRIIMRFIFIKKFFQSNEIIRFFFEFISILLIASIFDKLTIFIDYFFKGKYNTKKRNKYIDGQNILIKAIN